MAKQRPSVADFIASGKSSGGIGTRIEFADFHADSGVGGGEWKKTGVTGQPVSQSPSQLLDAKFNDSVGDEWEFSGLEVNLFQVGAEISALDNGAQIEAAVRFCERVGAKLNQTKGAFKSQRKITQNNAFEIDFSFGTAIYFLNELSCGWSINLASATRRFLFKQNLPSMYSPAAPNGVIPGYPGGQDTSSRVGVGFEVLGGNRCDFYIPTMQGWDEPCAIRGLASHPAENINIEVNTLDWNTKALTMDSTNGTVNACDIKVNTMGMAKYQFYFTDGGSGNKVSSSKLTCSGQMFIKEPGAVAVYSDGVEVAHDSEINIRWAYIGAVAGQGETPPEVTSDITLPLIGGSETQNSETGFFTGVRNVINAGLIFGTPGDIATFAGGRPQSGDVIRVKLKSSGFINTNKVNLENAWFPQTANPKDLILTNDEALYNGGVGGASIFKKQPVRMTLTSDLNPGTSRAYYMFHQLTDNIANEVFSAIDNNLEIANKNCSVSVKSVGGVNRSIEVRITNNGSSAVASGAAFNFNIDFEK